MSASCIESLPVFLEEYAHLQSVATEAGVEVVVGGRTLTPDLRQQMNYSAFCDTLRQLVTFAASLTFVKAARNPEEESNVANPGLESHQGRLCQSKSQKNKDS